MDSRSKMANQSKPSLENCSPNLKLVKMKLVLMNCDFKLINFILSQVIISGELNYSDPLIQEQVENLTQTFEASPYISSPLYTESWLRSFVSYVHRNQDYLNVTIDTEETFIKTLNEVRK